VGSSVSPSSSTLEHSRRGREPHKDFFYEDRVLPRSSEQAHVADAQETSVNRGGPGSSPQTLDFISTL